MSERDKSPKTPRLGAWAAESMIVLGMEKQRNKTQPED